MIQKNKDIKFVEFYRGDVASYSTFLIDGEEITMQLRRCHITSMDMCFLSSPSKENDRLQPFDVVSYTVFKKEKDYKKNISQVISADIQKLYFKDNDEKLMLKCLQKIMKIEEDRGLISSSDNNNRLSLSDCVFFIKNLWQKQK